MENEKEKKIEHDVNNAASAPTCETGEHWDAAANKCVKNDGGGLPPDPTHPKP